MTDLLIDKKFIVDALREDVIVVTFTKVNGDKRVMKCTLHEDYLPQVDGTTQKSGRPENPNVVSAWDIEKKDWRSFKIDSITHLDLSV